MEIKVGYKQTELGVIPNDWNISKLAEIGSFRKGKGISKKEANSGSLPCIRYGELYTLYDSIIHSFSSHISPEVAVQSEKLKFGDQLFAGSGETKDEIGKSAAFLSECEAYAGGDIVIFSPGSTNPHFLGYALNSKPVQNQKSAMAQGHAVVHIYSRSLKEVIVAIPSSSKEQRAIAEALSDVDALIASLETMIAKKESINQELTRLLVSGEKRLESFNRKWRETRLGELLDYEQPTKYLSSESEFSPHGSTPVLTANKAFVLGYTDEVDGLFQSIPAIIFDDFTTDKKYVTHLFKVRSSALQDSQSEVRAG